MSESQIQAGSREQLIILPVGVVGTPALSQAQMAARKQLIFWRCECGLQHIVEAGMLIKVKCACGRIVKEHGDGEGRK